MILAKKFMDEDFLLDSEPSKKLFAPFPGEKPPFPRGEPPTHPQPPHSLPLRGSPQTPAGGNTPLFLKSFYTPKAKKPRERARPPARAGKKKKRVPLRGGAKKGPQGFLGGAAPGGGGPPF